MIYCFCLILIDILMSREEEGKKVSRKCLACHFLFIFTYKYANTDDNNNNNIINNNGVRITMTSKRITKIVASTLVIVRLKKICTIAVK